MIKFRVRLDPPYSHLGLWTKNLELRVFGYRIYEWYMGAALELYENK